MKKICPGCEQERDIEQDFAWKNKAKRTRQHWCRNCLALANKKHYLDNKDIYIERALTRNHSIIAENHKRLFVYLSTHPCVDCGINDIRVLEFDHVRGIKTDNVAKMVNAAILWPIIEDEIEKCEVRCVNCHRIKTGQASGWWRFLPDNE